MITERLDLRTPVQTVTHESFRAFLKRTRYALALIAPKTQSFNEFVERHFRAEYPEQFSFGALDPSRDASQAWLVKHVEAAMHPKHRLARVVAPGYYLFRQGECLAYHDGTASPEEHMGAAVGGLISLALGGSGGGVHRELAKRGAALLIDAFERVLGAAAPAATQGARAAPAQDPYAVLGVSPVASEEDIDAAYHKQILENHPDRVNTMGPVIRAAASEQTKAINAARDAIRKQRAAR